MGRTVLALAAGLLCCVGLVASSRLPQRDTTLTCTFTGFVRFGNNPEDKAFGDIKSQEQETSSIVLANLDKKEVKLKESNTGLDLVLKEAYENEQGSFFIGNNGMAFRLYVVNWKVKKVYVYSIVNFNDGFSSTLVSTSSCK
jgi:hypothetical protein